ncbi:hypothetical protein B0H67DRAFT_644266 [Lasiosphaeris hirsuta]|uniref:Uncharacterized protein n=1 Tax=Lasiosphaeris hirsuta TaxID=260670 RepID=A0AA40ASC7_9PEZI|nr:hypothetical protein B0H67DRAFT_644266 [Lasiosphaeris hirsuta]
MKAFTFAAGCLVAIAATAPVADTNSAVSPKAARYFEYYSVPAGADGEAVKAAKGKANQNFRWNSRKELNQKIDKRDFLFYPVPSGADGEAVQADKGGQQPSVTFSSTPSHRELMERLFKLPKKSGIFFSTPFHLAPMEKPSRPNRSRATQTDELKGVDETYRWTQSTSTLFSQSQYVARPSPEVDALWKDLGAEIDDILIPAHYGKAIDVSPEHAFVEFEPGNPSFVVTSSRKSLFYNADYYKDLGVKEFRNHGKTLQMHIDHCLDMLRERLTCTADAGILPSFYTIYNTTTPDFKRDHHCRDYQSLQAWGKAAKALPKGMLLRPPEGAFVLEHVP